jgi:hypothetical protein
MIETTAGERHGQRLHVEQEWLHVVETALARLIGEHPDRGVGEVHAGDPSDSRVEREQLEDRFAAAAGHIEKLATRRVVGVAKYPALEIERPKLLILLHPRDEVGNVQGFVGLDVRRLVSAHESST